MPPRSVPPPADDQTFTDRHASQVQLETTVRGLISTGSPVRAHKEFQSSWESTTLPHLPAAVAFEVDDCEMDGLLALITVKEPEFSLLEGADPHNPERVAIMLDGTGEAVGYLPPNALSVLERAGEDRDLYKVRLLSAHKSDDGRPLLDMELVRPVLRQCEACGATHTAKQAKCDRCRAEKKRKKKGFDEQVERPSVPLQRTARTLAQHPVLPGEVK